MFAFHARLSAAPIHSQTVPSKATSSLLPPHTEF
nr:hypothetical protein Iba_chr02cCG1650 [Ipomoea batatas]